MLSSGFLWYTHFRLECCLCNQNLTRSATSLPLHEGGRHTLCSPFSTWRCWQLDTAEECDAQGGRTLLPRLGMQVWEPSGKEESPREVVNWHRETVFSNLLSCFSLSHTTVSSISHSPKPLLSTFPAKDMLCCHPKCKHILHGRDSARWHPRAWLICASLHLLQNCCDR